MMNILIPRVYITHKREQMMLIVHLKLVKLGKVSCKRLETMLGKVRLVTKILERNCMIMEESIQLLK